VEAAYAPSSWPDQHGNNLVLQHRCTLCTVLVYMYSGRLKYSERSPIVGQILSRIFSDTDMLESSGFFL
jgi:hypothetical protein